MQQRLWWAPRGAVAPCPRHAPWCPRQRSGIRRCGSVGFDQRRSPVKRWRPGPKASGASRQKDPGSPGTATQLGARRPEAGRGLELAPRMPGGWVEPGSPKLGAECTPDRCPGPEESCRRGASASVLITACSRQGRRRSAPTPASSSALAADARALGAEGVSGRNNNFEVGGRQPSQPAPPPGSGEAWQTERRGGARPLGPDGRAKADRWVHAKTTRRRSAAAPSGIARHAPASSGAAPEHRVRGVVGDDAGTRSRSRWPWAARRLITACSRRGRRRSRQS
jgi:hypothetical protein